MSTTQSQKTPKLRFPEFKDAWKPYRLSEFLTRYSENNKDQEFNIDDILSLSSRRGIVNRKELLEDTYDSVNHLNYKKTRLNDLVYGKSISANFPFGLFKINDYKDGLLSTLYFTFKVKKDVLPKFLDFYFSYPNRANKFLRKYVLVGDRYITADADYLLSGQINLPSFSEQQKITSFFTLINKWHKSLEKQEILLREYKKGVFQKIFSQEFRFKTSDNKNYPAWKRYLLGDVFSERTEKNGDQIYELLSVSLNRGVTKQDSSEKRDSSSADKSNYKVVYKNDIAYNTMRMWQGASGVSPFTGIVSPAYTVVFPKWGNVSFYKHLFKHPRTIFNFYRYSQGMTSDTWNLKFQHFSEVEVDIPTSIEEQDKIASFLDSIDELIANNQMKLAQVEEWKKGLLQQLFI